MTERCDECDPSFSCFDDSTSCRKQPLTDVNINLPGAESDPPTPEHHAKAQEIMEAAGELGDDALPDDVTERSGELSALDADARIGEYHTPASERARMLAEWQEMILKDLTAGHVDGKVIADDVATTDRVLGMARESAARVLEYALAQPAVNDQLVHDILICALAAGHHANVDEQSTPKGRQARRERKASAK